MASFGMAMIGRTEKKNCSQTENTGLMMDPAYVHISTEELKLVGKAFGKFEEKQIYMLGRYGRWTYNCKIGRAHV